MIISDRLDIWRIVTVQKEHPEAGLYAHHLLTDETAMGKH